MPELPKPSQERFAQNLARGGTQIAAYVKAGYTESRSGASVLANKPEIKQRVAEIRHELRAKPLFVRPREDEPDAYSEQWFCEQLHLIYNDAREAGDLKTARQCLLDIRKLREGYDGELEPGPAAQAVEEKATTPPSGINLQVLLDTVKQQAEGAKSPFGNAEEQDELPTGLREGIN